MMLILSVWTLKAVNNGMCIMFSNWHSFNIKLNKREHQKKETSISNNTFMNHAWWFPSVPQALGRLRQNDQEFRPALATC